MGATSIELVADELDHKLMLVGEGAIGAAEFIDAVADLVTIIRNVPQEVTFD